MGESAEQLRAADFASFMTEVHGPDYEPFPWQRALVEKVMEAGRWPDALTVPTGLGKTAVIDAFVFIAAACPDLGRRRLFFVVDRRLIVDEAHRHAQQIAQALHNPRGRCVQRVARALQQRDDDVPLQVTRMRGGVTWSWRWLERPDRFAVVVGTVDQVGSRLLFRGYGVGEHLRSIDAALVGTDSLIVVDEAHLAEPFRRTVAAIERLEPEGHGPALMTMSATLPDGTAQWAHGIDERDLEDERARPRLRVWRQLHLLCPKVTTRSAATVVPATMAAWARALAEPHDSGRVVAVVCNTVARARAVLDQITAAEQDVEAILLTGRIRPVDRDYLLARYYGRLRAGRKPAPGRPLIVVATQTIEVGANIDVDALVSESAALPALIQRLGRLNRLGRPETSPAVVVHDASIGPDDPVYGPAREATWRWLTEQTQPLPPKTAPQASALAGGLPVSPVALERMLRGLSSGQRDAMQPALPYVPELTGDVLDAWVRTSPSPHPDPPVAPYLHGLGHGRPDVSLVWRAGLPADPTQWAEHLQAAPPAVEETLQVPLPAARRWLAGLTPAPISDVEGTADDPQPPPANGQVAVRYHGPGQAPTPVTAAEIGPGDLLVVASERGGCDRYGWNPDACAPVLDVADLASRRARPLLRIRPQLLDTLTHYHPDLVADFTDLVAMTTGDQDPPPAATFRAALPAAPPGRLPFLTNLRLLADGCSAVPWHGTDDTLTVILAVRGGGQRGDEGPLDSSTGATTGLGLNEHERAVAKRAREFATNLGLPDPLRDAVVAAARSHDEGKRDPRFQAMLYQRPLRAHPPDAAPLAKSGMDPADRAAYHRARTQAGYPQGLRHEALSARLVQSTGQPDSLTLHLIATHHGRGRPLLPPVPDPDPPTLQIDGTATSLTADHSVDWAAPHRFTTLNHTHGRWRLALLETIVRLADIWCSERDESQQTDPQETDDDHCR